MDVKCPGRQQITTVFSHAQTVELCGNCNVMLCQPTGKMPTMAGCLSECSFFSLSGWVLADPPREWGVEGGRLPPPAA